MVIVTLNHVPQCFSAQDGKVIYDLIRPHFARGKRVTISFSGVTDMPSSFVNSALVPFIKMYGADWVRAHLAIKDVTPLIAGMIKRCFANAERALLAA